MGGLKRVYLPFRCVGWQDLGCVCVYITDVYGTDGRLFRKHLSTLQKCAGGVAGFRCVSTFLLCVALGVLGVYLVYLPFRCVGEGWQAL